MKKIKIIFNILEAFLLFFAFIYPSFLANSTNVIQINTNPPLFPILFRLIIIVYLAIRLHDEGVFHKKKNIITRSRVNNFIFGSIKIVLMLQTTAVICNLCTFMIPTTDITLQAQIPTTMLSWIWFFTSVIILATFEEFLYRGYFPEKILHSLKNSNWYRKLNKRQKIGTKFLIEFTIILIFALGHSYMGVKSIIVSFFCGIVLRLMVKLKRSLVQASCAHIINNIISYMVLFFVTN